MLALNNMG